MKLVIIALFKTCKQTIAVCMVFMLSFIANGQASHLTHDEVKDSIVAKFNRSDFKGIYQLFDTAFSNKISEDQLVNFLKGNQNSGKIVRSFFLTEGNTMLTYLLEFQLRDMTMNLEITPEKKIRSFGFVNSPPTILTTAPFVNTNNARKTTLDRAIDSAAVQYFRFSKANSLTIGIIKNGKENIYEYGEIEKGNGDLPTRQTLYELGSITKTFTATVLAQAVLDKKVSLTDDIRKYLPADYPNLQYDGTPITLRDLANHTSRLPPLPMDIGDQTDYDPVNPESHYDSLLFYNALKKVVLDTAPGYKFLYSNWGMSLLGHILENVYGQSHATLIKKYVTLPLGMMNTLYLTSDAGHKVAMPHSENGKRIPLANEGYFSPAGGLCSTVEDMLRYLDAQLKETKESIKLTHQLTNNNMGLGWGVRKKESQRDLQHNGSTQGSTANISAFPEINSGCVIMVNNKFNIGKLVVNIQDILKNNSQ